MKAEIFYQDGGFRILLTASNLTEGIALSKLEEFKDDATMQFEESGGEYAKTNRLNITLHQDVF